MDLIIGDIYFQYDVLGRYELVIFLESDVSFWIFQNIINELLIRHEHEVIVLIPNLPSIIFQEVYINMLTHFLLFIFDIRGDVFIARRMEWINEIDRATNFTEEERLLEFLLSPLYVNLSILHNDHVLLISHESVCSLRFAFVTYFGVVKLVFTVYTLDNK